VVNAELIGWLLERFREEPDTLAIAHGESLATYGDLHAAVERSYDEIVRAGVPEGAVVTLEADFHPEAVATLLALIERRAVIVPLTSSVEALKPRFRDIAQVEWCIASEDGRPLRIEATGVDADHELLKKLESERRPGLVLFSSGSTGEPKGALHDFVPLLEKFVPRRRCLRTMAFLLFDHIGGVNTMLYTMSNLGLLVVVDDRSPDNVCRAVEQHRVELLPTSPTFINLLLMSGAPERHDLSSLQLISYGTEVMPEGTLQRAHEVFPNVTLQQTYGLSEVGILRSKSRSSESLWVKVGGEGFETRVVDGLLEIKAKSAMLGYLNAPSPFTDDGWFKTGDRVEVDGEYLRILGRQSDMINVGGLKVDPVEVEDELLRLPGVVDAVVFGEPHSLMGRIVVARVRTDTDEPLPAFRARMREALASHLPRHMIPQKVILTKDPIHGERFKRMRH
jgi:acyl-coenzyme A synthetase/AMP-(fatty) acid ligase